MVTKNPALTRLVTSRYGELQGLLTRVDAFLPMYMGVTLPWRRPIGRDR